MGTLRRTPRPKATPTKPGVKRVYMAVTNDKYELPVNFGNAPYIAAWAGMSVQTLYSYVTRHQYRRKGNAAGCRFESFPEGEDDGTD